MSARRQRTEDKSARPPVEDKGRVDAYARTKPDPFEGTYDLLPNGMIRFRQEVVFDVPAPGGARTSVLVAPVGMVRPFGWLAERRDYYGLPPR